MVQTYSCSLISLARLSPKQDTLEYFSLFILFSRLLLFPSPPRLRHLPPIRIDGEWVEPDVLAAVGAGDFSGEGGGGDFGEGAALSSDATVQEDSRIRTARKNPRTEKKRWV